MEVALGFLLGGPITIKSKYINNEQPIYIIVLIDE
jgi:hypothetical protein